MEQTIAWFDTHAHLSDLQFDADREAMLERAQTSHVRAIVEIADAPAEWARAKKLAEDHSKHLFWAAGIHPYYAADDIESSLQALEAFQNAPGFVGIGETGLDYAKSKIPPQTQEHTFRKLIELAKKIDKPLIIHCREAYDDLMPILRDYFPESKDEEGKSPGVIHCFSGTLENAQEAVDRGFYLGVDGPLTYPNANTLRETLSKIRMDRIVLETDSPYLPPQSYRGKRNEPAYLPLIGQKLSELRAMPLTELCPILMANATRLFRLKNC